MLDGRFSLIPACGHYQDTRRVSGEGDSYGSLQKIQPLVLDMATAHLQRGWKKNGLALGEVGAGDASTMTIQQQVRAD
jgi:hypothetical protein